MRISQLESVFDVARLPLDELNRRLLCELKRTPFRMTRRQNCLGKHCRTHEVERTMPNVLETSNNHNHIDRKMESLHLKPFAFRHL